MRTTDRGARARAASDTPSARIRAPGLQWCLPLLATRTSSREYEEKEEDETEETEDEEERR